MKLTAIKINPSNPRHINKDKIEKLKKSIKDFEKMLEIRPIVIDENNMTLGGNMRVLALREMGYKEIPDKWIRKETNLTEAEKKEFIIKDNISFGDWDWDMLANEWDDIELEEWGLHLVDIAAINEMQEWNKANMPVFEIADKEYRIILVFQNEQEREEYKNNNNLTVGNIQAGTWTVNI